MKKGIALTFSILLVSIFLISFVSAITPEEFFSGALGSINSFLRYLIGNSEEFTLAGVTYALEGVILAKFLLLILVLGIVWSVLEFAPIVRDGWPRWVVSIIVSLLGVRFLPNEYITTILLPYNTMAVAMTAIIPFIIFALFVEKGINNSLGRKTAWLFFGIIFAGLWGYRVWVDQSSLRLTETAQWIYPVTLIAVLIMIALDRTIHGYFMKSTLEAFRDAQTSVDLNIINDKIRWADQVRATTDGSPLPTWTPTLGFAPRWAVGNKNSAMNSKAKDYIRELEKAASRLIR